MTRGMEGYVYPVLRANGKLDSIWTSLAAAEMRRRLLDDQGHRGARVEARALQTDPEATL